MESLQGTLEITLYQFHQYIYVEGTQNRMLPQPGGHLYVAVAALFEYLKRFILAGRVRHVS